MCISLVLPAYNIVTKAKSVWPQGEGESKSRKIDVLFQRQRRKPEKAPHTEFFAPVGENFEYAL